MESGHTPSRRHPQYWGGNIPWISLADAKLHHGETIDETIETTNDLGITNSSARVLPAGTVCLSRTASVGYVLVMARPMATSQDFVNWICSKDIDPDFLQYLFLSEGEDLLRFASGAVHSTIYFPEAKAFHVCIPSVDKQKRIVRLLDEAFAFIATAKSNAEKNFASARATFACALDDAMLGKLVPGLPRSQRDTVHDLLHRVAVSRSAAVDAGRAKPLKTTANLTNGLPTLPKGWQWTQLETLSVGITDGVHKKPTYTKSGVPFIKVNNLTAGPGISFDDVSFVSREDHQEFIKRTHPERGDILISKDGTIGVVRLIETDIEFSLFVSVALVKPALKELGPYLSYALSASSVQRQIVPQGAALKHLYLVDLRRLSIPLPPLSVQMAIVSRLDELRQESERLLEIFRRKIGTLDELRQSLLREAFSGRL